MDLNLDPRSSTPLYRQIVDQVRRRVAQGVLRPGDRLPTIRDLAARARVNRNTAARAFQELEASGLVHTRVGQGTFVAETAGDGAVDAARGLDESARRFAADARSWGADVAQAQAALRRAWDASVANEGKDANGSPASGPNHDTEGESR